MAKKGMKKLEIGSTFKITLSGTKPSQNKRYNDVKLYAIELTAGTSKPDVDALLSDMGAAPVASGKIEALDSKQVKVAETLQSNGFTAAEIAENLGVSTAAVENVLTF
jgi:DNA-binding NarL/FixJ family response regulator